MNQKRPFNAELYFANPEKYIVEDENGVQYPSEQILDRTKLFMIEKQPITTDIPFTLEDFKTGKYDVVDTVTEKVAEYVKSYPLSLLVVYESESVRYEERFYHNLRLRPKPISPFTHPELYEVSDNLDGTWFDIVKYYDFIENREVGSHTILMKNGSTLYYPHLRLKDQPTIITQQQADEAIKAKYPNYKIED